MDSRLSGVCPVLATPFLDDGQLDEDSLRKLVRFELWAGVDGLGLFGTASEVYALTEAEKKTILEIVVGETQGKLPLLVGTGSTSLNTAWSFSEWAAENGATILVLVPPYMVKPGPAQLMEYFETIMERSPVPIMIQDAPGVTGVTISSAMVGEVSKRQSGLQYVKVESPPTVEKMQAIRQDSNQSVTVFGGQNATYLYEELEVGSAGTMPACEFPDVALNIYQQYRSGEKKNARELFYRYLPFFRIGTMPGYGVSVHKQILHKAGIFRSAFVRNPGKTLTPTMVDLVFQTIEDRVLRIFDYCE